MSRLTKISILVPGHAGVMGKQHAFRLVATIENRQVMEQTYILNILRERACVNNSRNGVESAILNRLQENQM
uniref:Uncharacterized protein n=1 Tax=Arion vulgaris TaxID=1028688 RepID=A0A0B7A725_9EUPU